MKVNGKKWENYNFLIKKSKKMALFQFHFYKIGFLRKISD
ncbi:hypothetical protein LEP1GSC132_0447 [Leptospira kirschneri str. 200803703]|uniref:Uncharacterized protein n=1 Tax=Leptospira kirschneri str. 200802841 TaxID=1193047 RepID=A0A828Y7T5_9LEPT|nr:hypothetical protein LEP1GSC044_2512 [Leptospira kirschneri serovar Grippotyphosa str. RM52]EKO51503.1 hypothetical protein LEP1GSC131_0344 [Leptospira kirschneri str. 200802841]EKP03293.1 hypothetical protein LEP1GSC018_3288 [Leptospira kirschneri str. 2008720114]EKQ83523.1 hypothetical protein LEP1GSC064_2371 [Leptospira kirschneri serovar Grippotyphosa str. Moskva]EKR07455.1 hypothetical protein LEP1GSC122_2997 [Leptospira kirschneri serovar Valbuzzi str. 200702274]EMK06081.1 hypothetica